ncbi:MAG: response regulator transcription factor [Pseudomonadota bacterium]|nr:response regulator transcription factor [Pseudomonadota bacterium]
MPHKPRLLVVEDEPAIRTGLVDVFTFHGFDVDYAEDGDSGLHKALSGAFDMILLDVMLPKQDGYSLCAAIREQDRKQPVIMLTARNTDEDIIHGLSLGADDYVAKPFSITQLVLRVQAVLRRSGFEEQPDHLIHLANGTTIDSVNLCCQQNDTTTAFTKREMEILQYLHRHNERPVPREELLHKVWGYDQTLNIETRTVDIHIAKLRRKLEADPKHPQCLITVRGGGYKLLSTTGPV